MPFGLKEITDAIYDDMDRMVLRIGERLQTAFDEYPGLYETWVTEYLPFGLDSARRMRMVFKAFGAGALPPEILARCPRPWQSLFALSRLAPAVLVAEVEAGRIHPQLTVRQTTALVSQLKGGSPGQTSDINLVAGRLMSYQPEGLADDVREMLKRWLFNVSPGLAAVNVGHSHDVDTHPLGDDLAGQPLIA